MLTKLLRTENDRTLTIARMVLGFLFFVRGAQGLFGWFGGWRWNDPLNSLLHLAGLPVPLVLLAVVTDFFGGATLMAGLFTRIAALCVAADTVVTFILWGIGHGLYTDWLIVQGGAGGEYYLLAFGLALILAVKGAGAFSFDRLLFRRTPRRNRQWAGKLPDGVAGAAGTAS
jgi:putative oxidoreductase